MIFGTTGALSLSAGNRNLRRSRTVNAKKVQTNLLERQLQGRELLERPRDRAAPGGAYATAHTGRIRRRGTSTSSRKSAPRRDREGQRHLDGFLGSARLR